GNLSAKKTAEGTFSYYYDPLNQLIEVVKSDSKIKLIYDPLGRRIGKTAYNTSGKEIRNENYLYDGNHDIGTYNTALEVQALQLLGLSEQGTPRAVAIELAGKPYAVTYDCQRNVKA